jgi:putative peptidoglycan lipid II flippase
VVTIAVANLEYVDRPTGALQTSLNLTALPIGIIGSAIATAVFPTFSSLASRGDRDALGATFARTLRTMLFLAIPAAIGLIVLRYPITLLFERGAFGPHDVDVVAAGLLGWGVGIPVLVAVEILPRAFFALKDTWTPVRINLVTLAIAIILSIVGGIVTRGDSVAGVGMLAGVVSLTVAMEVAWLGIELRRRLANIGLRSLAFSALRSLVAGEAMAAALLALLYLWHHLGPAGQTGNLLLLIVAIPLGIAVYTGWAYVVRAPELATAWAMVRSRLRR